MSKKKKAPDEFTGPIETSLIAENDRGAETKKKERKLEQKEDASREGLDELDNIERGEETGGAGDNKGEKSEKSGEKINKTRARRDRYDPWRVEGKKSPKWKSGLLILLLAVMFLSAYGAGWAIGGVLRQRVDQQKIAEVEETEGPEEEDLDEEDSEKVAKGDNDEREEENKADDAGGQEVPPDEPTEVATGAIPKPDITGKKLIALTFDDGPSGAVTDQLLATLREKQVRATFFVLGYMAERSPSQLQKQISEGHEVGSHTMNHVAFLKMTAADLANDTLRMNQLFMNVLGHNTPFMRPPYGDGPYTEKARTNVGQPMILWTVDTLDWKYRDVATVRQNAVKDAFDGAIILFHDVYQSTADAIPLIIDDLRAQGYEFLTVSDLAAARGVVLQNGAVYGSFRP